MADKSTCKTCGLEEDDHFITLDNEGRAVAGRYGPDNTEWYCYAEDADLRTLEVAFESKHDLVYAVVADNALGISRSGQTKLEAITNLYWALAARYYNCFRLRVFEGGTLVQELQYKKY
jgi:hypothetical protein